VDLPQGTTTNPATSESINLQKGLLCLQLQELLPAPLPQPLSATQWTDFLLLILLRLWPTHTLRMLTHFCYTAYLAHAIFFLSENWFNWDAEHPSLNETLIAGCASYQAFNRYLSGLDIYLVPENRPQLERIL
jgi:hypothetical protein